MARLLDTVKEGARLRRMHSRTKVAFEEVLRCPRARSLCPLSWRATPTETCMVDVRLYGVDVSGFRVHHPRRELGGLRFWCLGYRFWIWGFEFGVGGSGSMVLGLGYGVYGWRFGFGIWGLEFTTPDASGAMEKRIVPALRFRVEILGFRI